MLRSDGDLLTFVSSNLNYKTLIASQPSPFLQVSLRSIGSEPQSTPNTDIVIKTQVTLLIKADACFDHWRIKGTIMTMTRNH